MWEQAKQALVESTVRFLTRFASLLPGLAALMVALFLSAILAWILAIIVRRLLVSLDFDERLRRWGFASLAEWSPMNSPTRLVSRSIASLVVMTGFLRDCGFRFRGDLSVCGEYLRLYSQRFDGYTGLASWQHHRSLSCSKRAG